ncbi:hypothetical protein IWQ60_000333 [Tieghemiomyces parasiticus]|uniref:RGS domain-containing protein n=1 Tax=Tieghemiomyces parasiticus TaxID=78921 RepID=A0A9W8DZA3_9FUNG|nr:hypothetical protein IWQ60_000333 [Tieghemiomyces parasiticus]
MTFTATADGSDDSGAKERFRRTRQIVYLSVIAVYSVFFGVTTALFYYRGEYIRDIKLRSRKLTVLWSLMGFIISVGILVGSQHPQPIPPFLFFWCLHIGYYLWSGLMLYRIMRFLIKVRQSTDKVRWVTNVARGSQLCDCRSRPYGRPALWPLVRTLLTPVRPPSAASHRPTGHATTSTGSLASGLGPGSGLRSQSQRPTHLFFCRHRCNLIDLFFRTIYVFALLVVITYCAVIQVKVPAFSIDPPNATKSTTIYYHVLLMVAMGFDLLVVYPLTVYLMWRVQDAYRIRNELIRAVLLSFVFIIIYIALRLAPSVLRSYVKPIDFMALGIIGVHVVTVVVPLLQTRKHPVVRTPGGLHPDSHTNDPEEKLTSNYIDFQRVLSDRILFQKLKETAGECFCPETIVFLEDYQRLKYNVYRAYLIHRGGSPRVSSWSIAPASEGVRLDYVPHSVGRDDYPTLRHLPDCLPDRPSTLTSPDDWVVSGTSGEPDDHPFPFNPTLTRTSVLLDRELTASGVITPAAATAFTFGGSPGPLSLDTNGSNTPGGPSFIEFPTPITYNIFATMDEVRHAAVVSRRTPYRTSPYHPGVLANRAADLEVASALETKSATEVALEAPHLDSTDDAWGDTAAVAVPWPRPSAADELAVHPSEAPRSTDIVFLHPVASALSLPLTEPSPAALPLAAPSTSSAASASPVATPPPSPVLAPPFTSHPSGWPSAALNYDDPTLALMEANRRLNDTVVIELRRMYRKFFSSRAEFTLPIEKTTMHQIKYIAERGLWKLDMFDNARVEILHLVYGNVFPKFLAHFAEILEPTRV